MVIYIYPENYAFDYIYPKKLYIWYLHFISISRQHFVIWLPFFVSGYYFSIALTWWYQLTSQCPAYYPAHSFLILMRYSLRYCLSWARFGMYRLNIVLWYDMDYSILTNQHNLIWMMYWFWTVMVTTMKKHRQLYHNFFVIYISISF